MTVQPGRAMRGRTLVLGFLGFLIVFVGALVWTQFFAYYHRETATPVLAGLDVSDYQGIDAGSSPLKLRGCFRIDPASVADLPPAPDATPLNAPFWFRCFDAGALTGDLASGAATAYDIGRDQPPGFDAMIAVYPDGRGYLWRQLNGAFD